MFATSSTPATTISSGSGLMTAESQLRMVPHWQVCPGGLAGDLMRLYPIQTNDMYPLKNLVTSVSQSLMVLPYNIKVGKYNKQLETLFDVEYKAFSELLTMCDSSVIVKQNKVGQPSEICGLVSGWKVSTLSKSAASDLCSRFFCKILKSSIIREKYESVIKIFSSSPVLLEESLLDDILETFMDSDKAQSV